ncbi:MAG TPA: HAMP domain-containing sensor histidine kinase, partial [Gemmatimonadales bacterium]|nr:HAMP domain-containing sensor histidine kinase [Gemmatimonadales bacterium]
MTFRTRILIATAPVVLVPLVVFGLGVRRAVRQRLVVTYQARVAGLVDAIGQDLARQGGVLADRLAQLRNAAAADNRLRLAMVQRDSAQRGYALDYAGTAMRLAGLGMLQIQDDSGRIVSSGHFRNEFDRVETGLPAALPTAPNGLALVQARTAEGPFLALARLDSLPFGDRRFTLVGGIAVDSGFLARLASDSATSVTLVLPGDTLGSRAGSVVQGDSAVSELPVPFIDESRPGSTRVVEARLVVAAPLAGLRELQRTVDRWFGVAVLVTLLVALLLAGWLSSRVSLPLAELAAKTSELDMDRLDVAFASDRSDEIGSLERLLGEMTERLRSGAARLRDAERHAAMGELARQVNHDIKNGIAPMRNVLRHLAQVARDQPAELPRVFAERRQTLGSSLTYLETLAANYAKLSPPAEALHCDVNVVTRETTAQIPMGAAELTLHLADGLPEARIDPLALRRIIENLVTNAVDSLDSQSGVVTVSTSRVLEQGRHMARIVVEDTGKGMSETELERAFQDFYSTKAGGTGLGLSIVRRLVTDAGGRLRVETSPGAGSCFTVDLPLVET